MRIKTIIVIEKEKGDESADAVFCNDPQYPLTAAAFRQATSSRLASRFLPKSKSGTLNRERWKSVVFVAFITHTPFSGLP